MSPGCDDQTIIISFGRNLYMVTGFGDKTLVFIIFVVIGLLAIHLL